MLVAAVLTGAAVYLLAGFLSGHPPRLRRTGWREPATIGAQQLWLTQAGVRLKPVQFWVGSTGVGAAVFVLVALATRTAAVAVVPAVTAAAIPRLYFTRVRARRLRDVQAAWPDGLRQIVASIAAGMSLPQSLAGLAVSGPLPLRDAFTRFGSLAHMVGAVAALEVVKSELADPTSDRVLEVLILAQQRGGRILPDVLKDLAEATTKDIRTLEEIATDALESKINARAVFVLPWIVLAMLTAQPGHFRDFYQSPGGLAVIGLAAAASLAGMWLVGRLSRDLAEPRVFDRQGP